MPTTTATPPRARRRARRLLAACAAVGAVALIVASVAQADSAEEFGVQPGTFTTSVTDAQGNLFTQAGGHPYEAGTSFVFNTRFDEYANMDVPVQPIKDVVAELPPGFIGNPRAAAVCTQVQMYTPSGFNPTSCPASSQVGEVTIDTLQSIYRNTYGVPLYNLQPEQGQVAVFGFTVLGVVVHVVASVRTDGDYGVTTTASSTSQQLGVYGVVSLALWGVPADPSHNPQRGRICYNVGSSFEFCQGGGESAGLTPRPFLSNPTNCTSGPPVTTLKVNSWTDPGVVRSYATNSPVPTGCDDLEFNPSIEARTTTNQADSPSGLEFGLHLSQEEGPKGLAPAQLKNAVVTLPPGLTVNAASANGLGACTPAEIGLNTPVGQVDAHFSDAPANCPDASKLGTVEATTPVLDHPLKGFVYLASQNQNPFASLLALYLVIEDPQTGLIVKLPGEVKADAASGRLTAGFRENPQVPVEDLTVDFFKGSAAALKTPATCGSFMTTANLTPWTTPEGADAARSDSFSVDQGAGGGACPSSEAAAANAPSFSAGTVNPVAGASTPFVLKLARADGTQQIRAIETTLPKGLLGKLAGIPYCSDASLAAIEAKSGRAEQAFSSCPAASQVGSVEVGAGAGPAPYYAQGKAYLAGPYKGAPLSLAIVTPAVAGPFDLGNVVVRAALNVDPVTAQIHAVSDPIPTILQGIPLDVRSIALKMDKPDFTVNPTNCEPTSVHGSATSVFDQGASLSSPFQVGDCASLTFGPKLNVQLNGATGRLGHPALKAVLTARPGEANIGRAQVNLPHGEFLDQGNLNKTCTKPVLLAGQCPASTVYGHATAWTPLLDKPLEGNVYLVGGYGYKLPALVADLNGQIRILLVGKVDSGPNKGIRNTFELVPDAPVSKFVLEMKGGKKYGLLENSEDLCTAPAAQRRAVARFTGQNGKVHQFKPLVQNQCGKGKKSK
jgi:hypothetical protein